MNKSAKETPFSEKTIKFRTHIVYTFFGTFNRPRRLSKGWYLFPIHFVYAGCEGYKYHPFKSYGLRTAIVAGGDH